MGHLRLAIIDLNLVCFAIIAKLTQTQKICYAHQVLAII